MSFTTVVIDGTPRALGRGHGEAMASRMHETVAMYEGHVAPAKMGDALEGLGPYMDAARKAWPDLADEIEGLAEGSGIDREWAWFLNCMEEVWPFEACVTISWGNFLLHAEQWVAGHEHIALLEATPDTSPSFVSPTAAGFIGAVGMNSSGFAQGIDSLTARDDGRGIPRVVTSRASLGAHSVDEAVEAARRGGRAGGYSHMIKSAARTLTVETTAKRAAVFEEVPAHTNHYLSEELATIGEPPSKSSVARLERAQEMLEGPEPVSLEDGMNVLADHGDNSPSTCLHGKAGDPMSTATIFGMVCDVTTGEMLVSEGRPCRGLWHETAVSNFFAERDAHVG